MGLSGSVSEEKRSEQVNKAAVAMEGGNAGPCDTVSESDFV